VVELDLCVDTREHTDLLLLPRVLGPEGNVEAGSELEVA
jgi:hypothetical protein